MNQLLKIRPIIVRTDSYKASHWMQYPPKTEYVSSYIESRGGKWDKTVFFGLQGFILKYLIPEITQKDVDFAAAFWEAHGEPFNKEGWEYIVNEHKGVLPLRIEAVEEGTVLPTQNVLVQVVNTDPKCYWLTSYIETAMLRAVWYPTTVATNSYMAKRHIYEGLKITSDSDPMEAGLMFKMHDFGGRGVSSAESAEIGGAAHLVNFMGTDTVEGILWADEFYGAGVCGFSIPASEHSTMTTWGGPVGEIDAMRNMVEQFAGPGKLFACVSDSYNIYEAVSEKWPELEALILEKGGTLVVRPDSGDPVLTPIECIEILMSKFGCKINSKGFALLPDHVRVIQGDGITEQTIALIIKELIRRKISVENIAFGQGGGLLQQVNRDTLKFAMKASAISIDGKWQDVYKEPIGQSDKKSKRGRLALVKNTTGEFVTIREEDLDNNTKNELKVVYDSGIMFFDTFNNVRERANYEFVM